MEETTFLSIAKITLVSGLFWFAVFYLFSLLFRRKKRQSVSRKVEFTLPDRENTFIRSRLSTSLNREFCEAENQEEKLAVEFTQALEMLEKIIIAPLSPAEKIEVGQMQSDLIAFKKRETFSVKDVSAINEKFSRILKLSAKYNV